MYRRISLFFLLVMGLSSFISAKAQGDSPQALVLTASGPLTPAMAEYLERGIRTAERGGYEVLVFQLNTPGGNIGLMNQMVQDIRGSTVPVVVYVAPRGAMAGSAGTLITLAGHASAMAPETIIGAASPIDATGQDLTQTAQAKEKQALEATARSLTERRGPQAVDLAQQTIENAKAVSSTEALAAGLVDFMANDVNDLLKKLDGFQVQMNAGAQTLQTANATVVPLPQSFIEQLLAALTDPNIVLILMNVGVVAILIEISHPGGWVAGFIGIVCLALATYGIGILPVNWFGIIFIILAFALFILDIKAPTHGALTVAGVASLIVGGLVLFNTPNIPGFPRLSIPVAVASSGITGAMFFTILLFALRAQRTPIRTGQERYVGKLGTATSDLSPRGLVQLAGEQWTAELAGEGETLPKGALVQVVKVDGIKLLVRKAE